MKPSWMQPMTKWKMGRLQSLTKKLNFRRKEYGVDEEPVELLPDWPTLAVEFTNRTTWHGLKYIAIPSRFVIRRIIWVMILLSNATLFLYIMTLRKDYLMSHPSTITVEVSYKDVLPFSAITICNHNQYRLTAMQELGLYDLLVNDLDKKPETEKDCGFYQFYPGICRIPSAILLASEGHNVVVINETTRGVCRRVCDDAYDWYCSGFLYDRLRRSCVLSPYTGEWLEVDQPACETSQGLEFYRRNRCASTIDIRCNFEDSSCILTNDPTQNDQWQFVEASGHAVKMDNTLDLASGHVANLLLTELRAGYKARLQSTYMNTTGKCIELFYWLQVDDSTTSESATLSVILITEEREEIVLLERSKGPKDWSRQFIALPDGIHQVVIEGKRGGAGQSGISIDDVAIQDCKKFAGNRNCKVTRRGRAYLGTINTTAQGEPCLPWETINSPLLSRLPDGNQEEAVNYCRNIPQQNWAEPSCFVRPKSRTVRPMPCDIPYCDCPNWSYFKCNNGMCLPRNLICNGIDDCLDGSDEHDVCNESRSIECLFDTDYRCGYESNKVGALFFSRVSASDLRYYYGASIISTNVSALEQLMLVDSKLGQMGDQVQLVSPLWTFQQPTRLSLTYIMMGSEPQPSDSKAGLYLYQYSELHVPVRQLFNATSFKARDLKISEVCVPSGTYHLMFLGVQGIPYESDFALDIVKIEGTCDYEEIKEDVSFDCGFRTMCGYNFISTSALLSWSLIYTKNAFLNSDANKVCSNVFGGIEGVIASPNYPFAYGSNLSCSFSIREPEGVTIIITFLEFSLEAESDCRFDRLEINDPVAKRTKVYCGDKDLPPSFESKGNTLNFRLVTDSDVNEGRFKLGYRTPITQDKDTDFAIALKYSGLRPSLAYTHSSKLISPPVQITSDSCVTIILMANANFTVRMGYLKGSVYTERFLLTSPLALGRTWHKLHLNVSPLMTGLKQFVLVLESAAANPGTEAAMISDIKLLNGTCRDLVTNGSLQCLFNEFDQCGYLDSSKDTVRWLRVYDPVSDRNFIRATFDPQQLGEAVLTSVRSEVTSPRCLKITYYSSSHDIQFQIDSLPSGFLASTNATTDDTNSLTFGNAYLQRNLPVGSYSIVIRAFLDGQSDSTDMQELRIYRIDVLDDGCAFNDTSFKSYCSFDNPNLCGYTVNYQSGAPWTWTKFDNVLKNNILTNMTQVADNGTHNNVMLYNGSSDHPLKGVLLTSRMVKQNEELMTIEAYSSSSSPMDASIGVYVESTWGHSFRSLHVEGNLTQNQWTNLSVCLPNGTFRVLILATTAVAQFVAIDNVYLSSDSCPLSSPVPAACADPDLSNCPDYHFSWSPQFAWRYTADIRNNTVIPGGDGCVRVYYEIEGVILYDESGKQFEAPSCDIYIKGLTTFTTELWFEEFEFQDCSNQYLEIWRYEGDTFTNGGKVWCSELLNYRSNPLVLTTDKVIQIRVFASKGFPRFRLRYAYTPDKMAGLFLALHYIDTDDSGTYSINHVAQWASAARVPTGDRVCLELDMSFPSSMFEVFFLQTDPENKMLISKKILERTGIRDDHVGWAHGSFEVPLETNWTGLYKFVFYVSVVNATFVKSSKTFVGALNNIFIYDGRCRKIEPESVVPSVCIFSKNYLCGYQDASQDSSRWILQSHRATYSSTSGGCKISLYGLEYVGNISQTISGRQCQRWDRQSPHAHNQEVADYFPDQSLDDAANHCRNPSNPFMIRTSWCYTTDPMQRREYCDIPYCLDYLMEAQMLAGSANRAVLISPPFHLTEPACLTFQYQLTSALVELTVKRVNETSSIPEILETYTIPMEPTVYVWQEGRRTLAAGTIQIRFVADKIDFTERDQFVSLDNISIVTGACPQQGGSNTPLRKASNRIPYKGPRLSRYAYRELVLNGLEDTSMKTLTSKMAHQLPQFIHKCDYGQKPCLETDFATEFTDMGQCYTFNYNQNDFRSAYTTGAESGARFILNVEQYEHVKNYVSGVGTKMHLHDQADIASMRDLGLAAMPGVHNLATISYTQSDSLPPPFGPCGSTELPYYDDGSGTATTYTEAKCRLEKKTQFVEGKCECKDIHMPGPSPFCNLDQHITCIKHVTETSQNISSSAVCPTACSINSFTVGLSQSQLSGLGMTTLLGNQREDLSRRYIQALEIRHRVDEDLMTETVKEMRSLISSHVKLKDYIYFAVLDRGTSIPRHIEGALKRITDLVFDDIVQGGGELLSKFESAYLVDLKPRESYLDESVRTLHAKLSLTKDLLKDLSVGRYGQGSQWYSEVVNDTLAQLAEFTRVLATYTRNTVDATNGYMPRLFEVAPCKDYRDAMVGNAVLLAMQLRVLTKNVSLEDIFPCESCATLVMNRIDDMLLLLSRFSRCQSEYSDFLVDFRGWLGKVTFDFKEFSNSINSEQVLNMFMHNEDWLSTLKKNYSKNSIRKLDLARQLNSDTSSTLSQNISNVVQDINQQIVVPLQNKITSTEESISVMYVTFLEYCVKLFGYTQNADVEKYARSLQIWRKPTPKLEIPEMLEFTLSKDETWQIWPTEKSMKSFVTDSAKERLTLVSMVYFSQLNRQLTNFLTAVNGFQNELSTAIETIKKSLKEYIDLTDINENFAIKNFLMLDIYYGEMKYEHISQSESYAWTNFFSDLGSYFGLLMGCSLLTMIEVLDLVIYYAIVKLIERYQKTPPVREVIEVNHVGTTHM